MKFFNKKNLYSNKINVYSEYKNYIDNLNLPNFIGEFIKLVNLHDGILYYHNDDLGKNIITFKINIGDLQVGYKNLFISYYDSKFKKSGFALNKIKTKTERLEILYDEFDKYKGVYIHRILFSSFESIEISFQELVFSLEKVEERMRL